jgi:GT2 family glycosyltransferase
MSFTYKDKPILEICLKSLLKTEYDNYKVIVADDCSTDNSVSYLKRKFKNVEITTMKKEGWFGGNNNNGMRYALKKYDPDYIALVSNDVIIEDKKWLDKLVKVAESDEKIGLVGPKFVYPDGRVQNAGIPFNNHLHGRGQTDKDGKEYSKLEKMEAVVAVTVLIKRKVIDKIGIFDENFEGTFEDMDFALRAGRAGFDIMYDGRVKLIHLHSYTASTMSKKRDMDYVIYQEQRNYGYFIIKNYKGIKRVIPFLWMFMRPIMVKRENAGIVGIRNFRIKGPILKKLKLSASAWRDATALYKKGTADNIGV